jgi:hypothetical protein
VESIQLAVVRTGRKWARFVIATEPGRLSSSPLYWDGRKWVPERRKALLYADPGLAEIKMEKLRAKT